LARVVVSGLCPATALCLGKSVLGVSEFALPSLNVAVGNFAPGVAILGNTQPRSGYAYGFFQLGDRLGNGCPTQANQ
jgi:hypothetical protein